MRRKCSHCGRTGHNSRTCTTKLDSSSFIHNNNNSSIIKLFGVHLDISDNSSSGSSIPIKKSLSLDCLSSSSPALSSSSSFSSSIHPSLYDQNLSIGYLSDGLVPRPPARNKGVPWSEEEHRAFLVGLEKLGKGDWRGISRQFVTTRTPTQVASHAQKYFLRRTSIDKKRRRASLFDLVESGDEKTRAGPKHGFPNIDLNASGQESSCGEELVLLHTIDTIWTDDKLESSSVNNKARHHHHHYHHLQPELELRLSSSSSSPTSGQVAASMGMGGPISVT